MAQSFTLSEIAQSVGGKIVNAESDTLSCTSFCFDSRKVEPGSLYIAYKGVAVDGHTFLEQAFGAGAVAAIVTDEAALSGQPGIVVADSRSALSRLSSFWYCHPSQSLACFGVTGTNGKTSVHWLMHHALRALDLGGVLIGTLGIHCDGQKYQTDAVTTPSAPLIHSALQQSLAQGAKSCSIEVSSHSVEQCRVTDIAFDVGLFLNLTPDHLDYHDSVEDYFEAKVTFFRLLAQQKREGRKAPLAVVNDDCPYAKRAGEVAHEEGLTCLTFGSSPLCDVTLASFSQNLGGSKLELIYQGESYEVESQLLGDFNGSNLAATFTALIAYGFSPSEVALHLGSLPIVPGRLERVPTRYGSVFVDYAHAPDALRSVLQTVRPLVENRLWVVFGCGGDRDPRRRSGMGQAANEAADCIVLTSDNPRSEEPDAIIDDIAQHCPKALHRDRQRRAAIAYALSKMEQGDVVIVAGRGHEVFQEIKGEMIPFSDMAVVREIVEEQGLAPGVQAPEV